MDVASPEKKPRFDAFCGNNLAKPGSQNKLAKSSNHNINNAIMKGSSLKNSNPYNFDLMWKGSVSNLMSSENITEDLIKESIKELEHAMQESKRMLVQRDNEISRLREYIANNKIGTGNLNNSSSDTTQDGFGQNEEAKHILEQLKESQERNTYLERHVHTLELSHSNEITRLRNERSAPPIWNLESTGTINPECTCHCGTMCKALHDLVDVNKSLETTKSKYENLKKRVREFKQQAGYDQQKNTAFDTSNNTTQAYGRNNEDRSTCCIQ